MRRHNLSHASWRRASFSNQSGACVEVAWHKSSHSSQNGNCVEVAANPPELVAMRDSKDPDGAKLIVSAEQWRAFLGGVRKGEFGR